MDLRAVYADEGSVGSPLPELVLTRCKHINQYLTNKEITHFESKFVVLMSERIIPTTGHILKSVSFPKLCKSYPNDPLLAKIKEISIPNLLLDESNLLLGLGIQNKIYITVLGKTTLGRYTVSSTLKISRKESIINFANTIGFGLTRKQNKLLLELKRKGWIWY
jgi:hypothetical protein